MSRNSKRRRRTRGRSRVRILLAVVVLVGAVLYWRARSSRPIYRMPDIPGLPVMSVKPTPRETSFGGCPPEGVGRDPELNLLKNRVDEGDYVQADLATVLRLRWPRSVEGLPRRRWYSDDAQAVAKYEGIPLAVDGYLAGAREEGPESTNCRSTDPEMHDFHLWLVGSAGRDRSASVVVEVTPRVRASHPEWSIDLIEDLVGGNSRVRISGWLMLDPEHPDQVGKTRGTLWEIHPVMKIEVNRNGAWITLQKV